MILAVALTLALGQTEPDGGVPVDVPDAGEAVVAAAPLPFEPPRAVPPPAPKAHWALWGQPLGMAGYAVGGSLQSTGGFSTPVMVYLPFGANVVLGGVELVVELTVTGQVFGTFLPSRAGVWLSAGPLFHTGTIPLNGFFVQPKLLGAYTSSLGVNFSCGTICATTDNGVVAVGLDVGYQFTFRKMYVAFVAGVGLGAGNYVDMTVVSPFVTPFGSSAPPPNGVAPVLLVNLNLLRVGGWN